MTTLQTRLAQADKPTRELLLEVWGSCPACNGDCGSANPPVMFCPTSRFLQLLDAEAWTSAVEMLTGKESTALADAIACLKARGL